MDAINELYSDNIVSIEGAPMPGLETRMEGIEAVRGKNEWWAANHEIHDFRIEGPYVADNNNRFGVYFYLDVTSKLNNQRIASSELGLYTVRDGKVVQEEFFYPGVPDTK